MRTNENFQRKTKNSVIYFQVGLIAVLVLVLSFLEFKFLSFSKDTVFKAEPTWTEEAAFVYNPEVIKSNPIETKTIKPVVKLPKEFVDVDIKKDDEVIKKEDLASENPSDTKSDVEVKTDVTNNNNNTTSTVDKPTIFSVEQLPMFKACKGLKRSEQKACFDEQLAKAISKNLVYPNIDLENKRQGTAVVEFVIDEKGNITNVKALDNNRATPAMQLAAEKAVSKLPKLEPAKQGDVAVKIKYVIPISFKVN
jgi:periplasmic protein TonB